MGEVINTLIDHSCQTIARRLVSKYTLRDKTVMDLLYRRDKHEVLRRAQKLKRHFIELLQEDFEKCPLNAHINSTIDCGPYRIENVSIQSLEGFYVPINLYVPQTKIKSPYPAIVVMLGHWLDAKHKAENQIMCANFALNGFIAAAFDPICQGERMLFDHDTLRRLYGDLPEDKQSVNMHTVVGNQSYMMGRNLASIFLWDAMRVVDYLCSRDDVDKERIGATGQSGGGTQTTYLAVADDRIKAYSPIQCLTKKGISVSRFIIEDCEQSILDIDSDEGFEYPDFLWAAFPKPVMVNAALEDFFVIEGVRQIESEITILYDFMGKREDFELNIANCEHIISPQTRSFAYNWFSKVLKNCDENIKESQIEILPGEQLQCFPTGFAGKTPIDINHMLFERLKLGRPVEDKEIRKAVHSLLDVKHSAYTVENLWVDGSCKAFKVHNADNGGIACRLYEKSSDKLLVVVESGETNLSALHTQDSPYEGSLLILSPFAMHIAASKRKLFCDEESGVFNASAVLGESVLELRVNQIISALDYVREISKYEKITVAGLGSAGVLALFAAFFESNISKVALIASQLSYDEFFGKDDYFLTETSIIPQFVKMADLCDIARLANAEVLAINPVGYDGEPIDTAYEAHKQFRCEFADDALKSLLLYAGK